MIEKFFLGLALLGMTVLISLFGFGLWSLMNEDPTETPANSGIGLDELGPMIVDSDFTWCDGFINGVTMHQYVAAVVAEEAWTFPTEEALQESIARCILVGQAHTDFPRGVVVNPEDE